MPSDPLLSAYAEATEATPVDLTRMRARIRSQNAAPQRRWLAVLAPVAGIAVVGLVVTMTADPVPVPVSASFDSTGAQTVQAGSGVSLTAQGTGVLSGTEQAPRLAWSAGSVEVSVEPGAGLDVQVSTDEAQVRVVGTVFTVDRGPLGTTVGVRRGEVAVDCVNGPQASITAGQTTTCWPTSAGVFDGDGGGAAAAAAACSRSGPCPVADSRARSNAAPRAPSARHFQLTTIAPSPSLSPRSPWRSVGASGGGGGTACCCEWW